MAKIIDHVEQGHTLPPGVEILEIFVPEKNLRIALDSLQQKHPNDDYTLVIKDSLNEIAPVEPYNVVSCRTTKGYEKGLVSMPKKLIVFKAGGDIQTLSTGVVWGMVDSVELAYEIREQILEIIDEIVKEQNSDTGSTKPSSSS